jgi:hypothetical protein
VPGIAKVAFGVEQNRKGESDENIAKNIARYSFNLGRVDF